MADEFKIEEIPREQVAAMLGRLLADGFSKHPDALCELVVGGQDKFVASGVASDRYGLSTDQYRHIYRRLMRLAKRMGLSGRVH